MNELPAVSLIVEGEVAKITINREASLNALSLEVLSGLLEAAREIGAACLGEKGYSYCRVAELRGSGPKAFAAGADIKLMREADGETVGKFIRLGQDVMKAFAELPVPVLAVVQGFALGGGMELALACDLILAGEQAKFGQPEVNLGLIPGFGGTQRLAARCGAGRTKRLVLTGETISAAEALNIGLADWVVPGDQLEQKAAEISKTLSSKAPLALLAGKRAINGFYPGLEEGLRNEVEEFLGVFGSADAKEGLNAFVEKRKASFTGR